MASKNQGNRDIVLALAILALLLSMSIFCIYYNIKISKELQIISIIFIIIPLMSGVYRFAKYIKDRTGAYSFFSVSFISISILFITLSFMSIKLINKFGDVYNYDAYEKVIKYEGYPEDTRISHFPSSVPEDSIIKEFEDVGSSSANSKIIVSFSLEDYYTETEEFKNEVNNAKMATISEGGIKEIKEQLYVPDIVLKELGLIDGGTPSSDFELYVIDASNTETNNTDAKYSKGIIVNKDKDKITYYYIKTK